MEMTNTSKSTLSGTAAVEAATPDSAMTLGIPAVRACGFTFIYPEATAGIGPLDWTVTVGSFHVLIGATGSGKTTLLRVLKPAISPAGERAGLLEVLGRPVDTAAADDARVGFVFQSPENQLVCDSVWHELAFGLENLGIPQDEMRRRVAEVAHFFGIEPWFRRSVDELSGGQKQVVALASVLAMRPSLLLLDEPTAQLDPVAEKSFLHALFRVNRELGITVVVATHAPEAMAAYATDAVCLSDGRIEPVSLERFEARPLILPTVTAPKPTSAPSFLPPRLPAVDTSASIARAGRDCVVSIRDAYVRYCRSDDWVLRGLDLEVKAGSVHMLVGGNGCGKSTLLKLVAGVLKPQRGSVTNRLSARQALLPQDAKALFVCDTVDEELREWQRTCGYGDDEVTAMLNALALTEHTKAHPFDLSGGQQQMLAFGKLALTRPALMLLDEPTKGLDAATKLSLARFVRSLADAGATVLAATHDLAFAALVGDEATMLFDGEAACTQPVSAFFADNLFYRPVEDAFARLWMQEYEQ